MLKQKPLAFKKDVQKYVQNHIGNHGEAMKILALIVNGSDSDSDTNGSDSDTVITALNHYQKLITECQI